MRKEVLWAIIAGVLLGLVVGFGAWRINSSISGVRGNKINLSTPTPQPKGLSELKVVLDKPENNDIVTTDTVNVSGITKPLTWVAITGDESDYVIQSDKTGVFTQEVDLTAGINQIKVTAFDDSGLKSTTEVLVIYSSNFQLKSSNTSSASAESTSSSDIRKKVEQDVLKTLYKPKAYIGTVTDVTDSTLEIKNDKSEIGLISVSTETSVTNSTGTTTKQVKTTDIAIGDFIVAMGYVDNKSVLSAQRVLITSPISDSSPIQADVAKVSKADKKAITISRLTDSDENTIQANSKIYFGIYSDGKESAAKFANFAENDKIIYVVTTDSKGKSTVRSVFKLGSV